MRDRIHLHRLRARHAGIISYMRSANEKRRYIVTSFLIGWAHTQNDPGHILGHVKCFLCPKILRVYIFGRNGIQMEVLPYRLCPSMPF